MYDEISNRWLSRVFIVAVPPVCQGSYGEARTRAMDVRPSIGSRMTILNGLSCRGGQCPLRSPNADFGMRYP